ALMISPGERGADGAATLLGAAAAAGSSGRGRGTDVLSVTAGFTGPRAPLNMGAGCEPDCSNSRLIRIASVTKTPSATPTASRGLHPNARNRYVARPLSTGPLFPRSARAIAYALSVIGMLAGSSRPRGTSRPGSPSAAA